MAPRAPLADSWITMVRLLLVDHPPAVRRSLRDYLSLAPDLLVVAEADDLPTAAGLAADLRPDVVLLDAEMPDLDLPAAVRLLRARSPASRIVVFGLAPAAVARALPQGGVVVVGKHEGTAALLAAARGRRA